MKRMDYECPNCGGKMILAEDQKSKKCMYCGSLVLLSEEELENAKEIADRLGTLKNDYLDSIKDSCRNYAPKKPLRYLTCESLELAENSVRIRKYFKIPEQEELFFVYDTTKFSTFKYGFVICTSGLYYRMGCFKNSGMYTWEQFKKLEIHAIDGSLYVGRMLFNIPGYKSLGTMLLEIQEKI